MFIEREYGQEHPGIHWGPFTLRIPFLHTRPQWAELAQGLLVAGATGLALVPILTLEQFGLNLSFEEAIACVLIQSVLICSAPIIFGDPFAPGMVTPALPLALTFMLATSGAGEPLYPTPEDKFRFMAAVCIDFAAILLFLGITGLGRRFIDWLPRSLKAAIIMGAALAALKRVFVDDAPRFLFQQPVSTILALAGCMLLAFSVPVQRLKKKHRWLAWLAGLGLLPGFVIAAVAGPFIPGPSGAAEIVYEVEWGILIPPFGDLFSKVSPFAIGFPSIGLLLHGLPLALMGYVILFGDIITGTEVLRLAMPARPDEKVDINHNRTHLHVGLRNVVMALTAPFFPWQGCLWTGVHVVIVQKWAEGRRAMDSIHSGIASYYMFGAPLLYLALPVVTALKPLMGIALSLTLALTGFACAYVAMEIPKTHIERGVVIFAAAALAFFGPWAGITIAVVVCLALVGVREEADAPAAD